MSVYIHGMEMPKHGSYLFTVRYDADGNLCVYPLIYMTGYDDRDLKPETPLFPLIPVPDHGRLIDADALIDDMANMVPWVIESPEEIAMVDGLSDGYEAVKAAPTIIPADKEGE